MERKLKRFNILLDDESLLYFPGSFLTGKVLLELEENTPASGLYFHIIGEGVVRFSSKRSQKTLASDRENYIDFRMRLLGDEPDEDSDDELLGELEARDSSDDSCLSSSSGFSRDSRGHQHQSRTKNSSNNNKLGRLEQTKQKQKILVLSPGVHTFPFKLGLPPNLPSTFLGLHGWVQYFCRAVLKEPSGLVHKNQQVFIIINPIDLNNEAQQLQQPFYCEAEERISATGAASLLPGANKGTISCKVRLDRGAFVPGENILISASIENSSRQTIKRTRAILTETVEYRAKNRIIQSETRELACVERGKIAAKSTDVWKKEPLHIPALPPTNLRGCHLIKIHYDVFFQIITTNNKLNKSSTPTTTSSSTTSTSISTATTNNRKGTIELQLPIVMATYPIRNSDGTLKRRKGASYPNALPIFRPWMETTNK